MAGYSFSNTPITDDNVFLAALVPVIVEHHITAGVSHKVNDKHQVHLAAVYAPPNKMRDTGRGDLFSRLGKGSTLKASGVSCVLGYSYLW